MLYNNDSGMYVDDNIKHRKRKKRSVKKSNHKHIYKLETIKGLLIYKISGKSEQKVMTRELYKCEICGREKIEGSSMGLKEFEEGNFKMEKQNWR